MKKNSQQPTSHQQRLRQAVARHQAGDRAGAETIYRELLPHLPRNADLLHLLGLACHETGRPAEAVEWLQRAVAVNPGVANFHNSLGQALRTTKQWEAAVAALRQAVQLDPGFGLARRNLGLLLFQLGDPSAAWPHLEADARGGAPDPPTLRALGFCAMALRNPAAADRAFAEYLRFNPTDLAVQNERGIAWCRLGRFVPAVKLFTALAAHHPEIPELHCNLGNALAGVERLEEARASHLAALRLRPDYPYAQNNLAAVLRELGELDTALELLHAVIARHPEEADAHFGMGFIQLLRGELQAGWENAEWRYRLDNAQPRIAMGKTWRGEPLAGKSLLLYTEQGAGDAIQFVRYLPGVAARGGVTRLACEPWLRDLFAGIARESGVELVERAPPWPESDYSCPLLSLPLIFTPTLAEVPAPVPYLHPAAPEVREVLDRHWPSAAGITIGLAWTGNPNHLNNHKRSCPARHFAVLAGIPGAVFFNLQKGEEPERPATELPTELAAVDLTPELTSFAATAELVQRLDLVITVDTSIAHLAGALGRPTWLLLPFAPDWRWLLEREDSPWYPTLRLFRQGRPGDWEGVVRRVRAELERITR